MRTATEADRRASRRLFVVLVLLAAAIPLFLIADRRLVRGHETRRLYETQHAFLSGCSSPGSIPLWMPFEANGVVSNPTLHAQAGLFQSVLMLAGPALGGADFLSLFYVGLFLEELLFLAGVWALARRRFDSPLSAFFVAAAALGSTFWLDHASLNVHAIFALPLMLSLLHGFLDDGSRTKLLLAGNLAAVQALGAPPGAGLVAPLAALLYFAGVDLIGRTPVFRRIRELNWKRGDFAVGAALVVFWLPAAITALAGTRGLVSAARAPQLHDVLVYAGLDNPLRYLDFAFGATPSLDWSLYCGSLTLAFAIVALLSGPRATMIRVLIGLPLALLALGLALFLFYLAVPILRPLRPFPVGTPLVRLFVVFLAGAGFQRMLEARETGPLRAAARLLLLVAAASAALSWAGALRSGAAIGALLLLVRGEPAASTSSPALEPWAHRVGGSLLPDLMGAAALAAGLAGALLLLWGSGRRATPLAVTLILILHPLDVFGWKFRMSWLESFPANRTQASFQQIAPCPYPERRVPTMEDSRRFAAFHAIARHHPNPNYATRTGSPGPSAAYWWADPDIPDTAESWMEPWSRRQGLRVGEDKLQVLDAAGQPVAAPPWVLQFDPNTFRVRVDAPAGSTLFYADVVAPGWQATVNGAPREIRTARGAYKSVALDAGQNVVEFRYRAPLRTVAFFVAGVNALLWLLWTLRSVFWLALRGTS